MASLVPHVQVLHIQLGDFVEINLSQEAEHFAIMEVNELFEDLNVCL